MSNTPNWRRLFSNIATGLTKEQLEPFYDYLAQTQAGRRLLAISESKRWILNLAFLLAGALAEPYLSETTPFKRFIKEILTDASSEIGARIRKGSSARVTVDAPAGSPPSGSSPRETKKPGQSILELNSEELDALLIWLKQLSPEDRKQFGSLAGNLSSEELHKFSGFSPELKTCLLNILWPSVPKSKLRDDVQADLDEAHKRLNESLRRHREGRA